MTFKKSPRIAAYSLFLSTYKIQFFSFTNNPARFCRGNLRDLVLRRFCFLLSAKFSRRSVLSGALNAALYLYCYQSEKNKYETFLFHRVVIKPTTCRVYNRTQVCGPAPRRLVSKNFYNNLKYYLYNWNNYI